MAKSTNNAGNAKARPMEGPAGRRLERNAKRATATKTKTAKATTARRTKRGTGARTSASQRLAGPEGLPASRAEDATAKRTTQRARQEKAGTMEGHARRLRPITQRQSRDEILATVAADSGVERPIVERVARSLATTYTRHLMRNGSGRVEILDLGAALWRGKEGARAARKMASGILGGRIVDVPARKAMAVPRLRVHQALREIVARA